MTLLNKLCVYLDYNSSTPVRKSAIQALQQAVINYGNPSSIHQKAGKSKAILWSSRQELSQFLSCEPYEIIFTSGASESNNHVLKGLFKDISQKRNELIISAVEHSSILSVAEFLSKKGFIVHKIPVSKDGVLDEKQFDKCLSERTMLVSIMLANNETGVIFPIEKFVKKTHKKGGYFHSDMTQGLGKYPIHLKNTELDFASLSAHKCYGIKGCGLLYCKKGLELENLIHGGGQERKRRAGTENVLGIAAFGAIAKESQYILTESQKLKSLRDAMEESILSSISNTFIIGQKSQRLVNTSCIYIANIEGETLLMNLDLKGISVSVGSACSSGKINSHSTLTAMGWSKKISKSVVRISMGLGTTAEQLEYFQNTLQNVVKRLRNLAK